MWQRSYVDCCVQMGQWKALEELGKHVDDFNLLADVYSHCLMWRELKENILPFALVRLIEEHLHRPAQECSAKSSTDAPKFIFNSLVAFISGAGINLISQLNYILAHILAEPLLHYSQNNLQVSVRT